MQGMSPRTAGSRLPLRATVVGRQVHFQMECPISVHRMPEREGCDDDNEAITRVHDSGYSRAICVFVAKGEERESLSDSLRCGEWFGRWHWGE